MEQPKLKFFEERRIFSVSEIVGEVRGTLETQYRDLWVQGEISNFRAPSSGHWYFTLKDNDSQIHAVCFRLQARYVKFQPEDGMDVLARGSVTVYPPRGQLQLVVEFMEPVGRGALQVAFDQLREKLEKEGLFDPSRKKRLPLFPSKIGVVTSPSGAAIQDILRVLQRRNDRLNVLIFPARVQGAGAAEEIARGIDYLNTRSDIDVIIVGRGGGSVEDLWAFNEEGVARAIFRSQIPVISAVGHEIDFTIADFVADLRAPTPSAAAEIVSSRREELSQAVESLLARSRQALRLIIHEKRRALHRLASSRALLGAESQLKLLLQRLDELQSRLYRAVPSYLEPPRQKLLQLQRTLHQLTQFYLRSQKQRLASWTEQLKAFSPLAVLERGYAIVRLQDGTIVRQPGQVREGERFGVRVAGGEFTARKE